MVNHLGTKLLEVIAVEQILLKINRVIILKNKIQNLI